MAYGEYVRYPLTIGGGWSRVHFFLPLLNEGATDAFLSITSNSTVFTDVYVDGVMFESVNYEADFPVPFISHDSWEASAGTVRFQGELKIDLPMSCYGMLDSTHFWIAMRFRPGGFNSGDTHGGVITGKFTNTIFTWSAAGGLANSIRIAYEKGRFFATSQYLSEFTVEVVHPALNSNNVDVAYVIILTANTSHFSLAVHNSAVISLSASGPRQPNDTPILNNSISSSMNFGPGNWTLSNQESRTMNGDLFWFAVGNGALTASDYAVFFNMSSGVIIDEELLPGHAVFAWSASSPSLYSACAPVSPTAFTPSPSPSPSALENWFVCPLVC